MSRQHFSILLSALALALTGCATMDSQQQEQQEQQQDRQADQQDQQQAGQRDQQAAGQQDQQQAGQQDQQQADGQAPPTSGGTPSPGSQGSPSVSQGPGSPNDGVPTGSDRDDGAGTENPFGEPTDQSTPTGDDGWPDDGSVPGVDGRVAGMPGDAGDGATSGTEDGDAGQPGTQDGTGGMPGAGDADDGIPEGDGQVAGGPGMGGSGWPEGMDEGSGPGDTGQVGGDGEIDWGDAGRSGRSGELDREFDRSLEVFDGEIREEQERIARAGGGSGAADAGGQGAEADEGDGAGAGRSILRTGNVLGDERAGEGPDTGGAVGHGRSDPPLSDEEIEERIPDDVSDGSDDDIVARQIREAAINESDPELREKLWEEYREYKESIGRR